jgi:hypothetical protein
MPQTFTGRPVAGSSKVANTPSKLPLTFCWRCQRVGFNKKPAEANQGVPQFSLANEGEQFRLNSWKKTKEIQSKKLAIGNVEKDSCKPIKIADRKQASRDRKQASRDRKWVRNNAKDDDWSDRLCDQRRGFDAALPLKAPAANHRGVF